VPEYPLIADHGLTHSCTMGAFVQRHGSDVLDALLLNMRSGGYTTIGRTIEGAGAGGRFRGPRRLVAGAP
jgi:hypothetical protein